MEAEQGRKHTPKLTSEEKEPYLQKEKELFLRFLFTLLPEALTNTCAHEVRQWNLVSVVFTVAPF